MVQVNFKFIFIILMVIFIIIPILIGELVYNWDRHSSYADPYGYSSTTIQTSDNINLQLWYSNNSYEKVIILIHGHMDNSYLSIDRYGEFYNNLKYDVVAIDLRNHGRSDSSPPIGLGVTESIDVIAAIDWVKSNNMWGSVSIMGTSMGAVASLIGVNERLDQVDKIILDSIFLSPKEAISGNLGKHYVIEPWNSLVMYYLTTFREPSLMFPSLKDILSQLKVPTLVIHGSNDVEVPPSVISAIDALNNTDIETHVIEGGSHSRLYLFDEYNQFLINFLGGLE